MEEKNNLNDFAEKFVKTLEDLEKNLEEEKDPFRKLGMSFAGICLCVGFLGICNMVPNEKERIENNEKK